MKAYPLDFIIPPRVHEKTLVTSSKKISKKKIIHYDDMGAKNISFIYLNYRQGRPIILCGIKLLKVSYMSP